MSFKPARRLFSTPRWPARNALAFAGLMLALLPVGSAVAASTNEAAGAVSASEQARELLVASIAVGPGRALANKAIAIQEAVDSNPPNTATACADLTDFAGLVTAQSGKHLSQANSAALTIDAMNLAAALGC